jgi:hypothetical protein
MSPNFCVSPLIPSSNWENFPNQILNTTSTKDTKEMVIVCSVWGKCEWSGVRWSVNALE